MQTKFRMSFIEADTATTPETVTFPLTVESCREHLNLLTKEEFAAILTECGFIGVPLVAGQPELQSFEGGINWALSKSDYKNSKAEFIASLFEDTTSLVEGLDDAAIAKLCEEKPALKAQLEARSIMLDAYAAKLVTDNDFKAYWELLSEKLAANATPSTVTPDGDIIEDKVVDPAPEVEATAAPVVEAKTTEANTETTTEVAKEETPAATTPAKAHDMTQYPEAIKNASEGLAVGLYKMGKASAKFGVNAAMALLQGVNESEELNS